MQTEWLPIVDETDQVIGQKTRQQIHQLQLRHRAVHILVFNSQGQIFLQKRSMQKDLNKGLWDTSAAGHVDPGETYLQAARRELQEELGIDAELQFLFKLDASEQTGMEFIEVYRCVHDGPFDLNPQEIDDGVWMTPDALQEQLTHQTLPVTETFKLIWQQYQKQT
jgi:isopentenyl-diphosphate delta-isomerase type 1